MYARAEPLTAIRIKGAHSAAGSMKTNKSLNPALVCCSKVERYFFEPLSIADWQTQNKDNEKQPIMIEDSNDRSNLIIPQSQPVCSNMVCNCNMPDSIPVMQAIALTTLLPDRILFS